MAKREVYDQDQTDEVYAKRDRRSVDERIEELAAFATAALTGLTAVPANEQLTSAEMARVAFDIAAAMQATKAERRRDMVEADKTAMLHPDEK